MTEKEIVLKALKEGQYEVEITEPNNVSCCTRYDGSYYYVMRGDSERFGVSSGMCTVYVGEHTFECELDWGEWSGDELLEDEEIVDALESADGVISGSNQGLDGQWAVYAAANNITEDCPYYYCEDEDRPKDVDDLDGYYEDINVKYALALSHGACSEWNELEVEMNCADIYDIYKSLDDEQKALLAEGEEIELSMDEIKNISEDMYSEIEEAVNDDASDSGYDEDGLEFVVVVSKEYFDSVL